MLSREGRRTELAKVTVGTTRLGEANIVMIMGDDIGRWNIGAYHRGLMAGRTQNLRLGAVGRLKRGTRTCLL